MMALILIGIILSLLHGSVIALQNMCLEKLAETTDEEMFINLVALPYKDEMNTDWMAAGTAAGRIEVWQIQKHASVVRREMPLLDLGDRVVAQGERGLLGIAFHSKFVENGRFFVSYSCSGNYEYCKRGDNVIEEYTANSPNNTSKVYSERDTSRSILHVSQPQANHNGGQILFSPDPSDSYLYCMFGDGGGTTGDSDGNAQNLMSLLGKILRIDISDTSVPYRSPPSNPFIQSSNARNEIWAYGLRNPWRCSFDTETFNMICGDVGQDEYEEIDWIQAGKNYGWNLREASSIFDNGRGLSNIQSALTNPLLEYDHTFPDANGAASVCGGYVYHTQNTEESCMEGSYVFGDFYDTLMMGVPTDDGSIELVKGDWMCATQSPFECGDNLADLWTMGEGHTGAIYLSCARGVFRLLEPSECDLSCP